MSTTQQSPDTMTANFTDEEAKVYDRQIRLWGIQAQQKIRSANVLVIGLAGPASEVVKNLVLSGINSITLVDDQPVTHFDMLSNLFTNNQIGQNRAEASQRGVQELNPRVTVKVRSTGLGDILVNENEDAHTFIKKFNVVVLVNHDADSIDKLNQICRSCEVPFFSACTWGYFSFVFCDAGTKYKDTEYVPFKDVLSKKSFESNGSDFKRSLDRMKRTFLVPLTLYKYYELYGEFPQFVSDEENQSKLFSNLKAVECQLLEELKASGNNLGNYTAHDDWHDKVFGQFSFTSSIIGGFLAQDVINSITEEPIQNNCFLFNGQTGYNVDIGY